MPGYYYLFITPASPHSYYFSNTIKGASDNNVDNNDNDGDSATVGKVDDDGEGAMGDVNNDYDQQQQRWQQTTTTTTTRAMTPA